MAPVLATVQGQGDKVHFFLGVGLEWGRGCQESFCKATPVTLTLSGMLTLTFWSVSIVFLGCHLLWHSDQDV